MKGSTLIIMKAKEEEENSWLGGMAVPSWIEGEW